MNVLIYVLDALRADHLSCYGYKRETTPNIDQVASEGIKYEKCYSTATWTKPVGASLLTGAYPPVHGARTREDVFNTAITRLPEMLSKRGFQTIGFSTMGNISSALGYGQGFDKFVDIYKEKDIIEKRQTKTSDSEELDHEITSDIALPLAEDLTDYVIEQINGGGLRDPFFAFCWSIEPHIPYTPPTDYQMFTDPSYVGPVDGQRECLPKVKREEDLKQLIGLYDGEIKYNDHEFGRIIESLKKHGQYRDTLIIVLGDHGDGFNEHDQLAHGNLPHDELIHVPLIIKPPRSHNIDSKSIGEIVSVIDIFPTICSAASIKNMPKTVQGRRLPPYGPEGSSAPVYSETRSREIYPAFYSIRTDEWKYIEIDPPDRSPATLVKTLKKLYQRGLVWNILQNPFYFLRQYIHDENRFLYDLESDPEELNNLVEEKPKKANELSKKIQNWMEMSENIHKSLDKNSKISIDDQTSEQLKQLGYVD